MEMPSYTPDFKPPHTMPDGRVLHAAFYRELPLVIAQGETPGDALNALRELIPLVIAQMQASNQPIPDPLPPPTMRSVTPANQPAKTETGASSVAQMVSQTFPAGNASVSSSRPPATPAEERFSFV
jgi:predicted RNase H-like HicB family nuclease